MGAGEKVLLERGSAGQDTRVASQWDWSRDVDTGTFSKTFLLRTPREHPLVVGSY